VCNREKVTPIPHKNEASFFENFGESLSQSGEVYSLFDEQKSSFARWW
jgi:hypothetical protein